MKLKGLVAVEYILDNWSPKILLVLRNEEGEKEIKEVNGFQPYIFIDERDSQLALELGQKDIIKFEQTDKKYILDNNRKLIKVIFKNPIGIYKLKGKIETFESDILFTNKFIIDNVEKLESVNYRIQFLDIETTSDKGFPNYLNANENIISLALYDNYYDKSYLWIWHEKYNREDLQQVYDIEIDNKTEKNNVEIRRFESESEMLNNYLSFIVKTKPDIITSWNVSFDVPYLVARMEMLNLEIQKLSPFYDSIYKDKFYNGLVEWKNGPNAFGKRFGITEGEKNVQIKGLYYFDMLTSYKNIVAKELQSFRLDFVAQKELNIGKLKTHFDIQKKWKEDPEFIEKYNYIDVFLIKKLNDKMKIIERYNTIRNNAFLPCINDVFSTGRVLDSYILKKYKDEFIFPSKVYDMNKESTVAGGLVRSPSAGVYKNIAVFDFSGFYPNLMKTFNLSSEKLIKEEIIFFDIEVEETLDIKEFGFEKMYEWNEEKKEVTYKIRTNKFKANLTYKLDNPGVLTQAVTDLMELRKEYKKEKKKYEYGTLEYEQAFNQEFSMKFLINGIYGSCAYPGFRLFKQHNANAITAFARMAAKWVSYKLEVNGWKTLYNDTDSIFTQLNSGDDLKNNLKEIEEKITPIINQAIEEFAKKFLPERYVKEHTLKMDAEKIYKSLLLMNVKKRYIGILKYYDGKETTKTQFMGLDLKKSSTIELCKKAQLELAECVLNNGNYKDVFEKYYKIVNNSNDIELFKIPSKLEKNQDKYKTNIPAKRASLWSNKNLGTQFRGGTKFYLLYINGLDIDVIAFEDVEDISSLKFKINKEKYINDLYNKFCNLIRGIKEIDLTNEQIYLRFKSNNKCLFDFVK